MMNIYKFGMNQFHIWERIKINLFCLICLFGKHLLYHEINWTMFLFVETFNIDVTMLAIALLHNSTLLFVSILINTLPWNTKFLLYIGKKKKNL